MSEYELEKFESKIREKIYSIRGFQVMLDRDLAELYRVETKYLNRVMKRNSERFPSSFCFQLNETEYISLRCQFVTIKTDGRGQHRKYLPYVFTEQGVAMLSAVLNSKTAIEISVRIMSAFIEMRKFIQTNAQVFQRLDRIELKQIDYDQKFDKLFSLMESGEVKQKSGVFYDGQVYDAYKFVSDIFKSAEKSILIIDNYIDDSVLTMLSKRITGVKASIYSKSVSDQLKLDVKKFNEQYEPVEIVEFSNSHDRFIIIDENIIYHFGASLKDLGKKWFGFSRMDIQAVEMLSRLGKQSDSF